MMKICRSEVGYDRTIKTEAIKEFAERLEADLGDMFMANHPCVSEIVDNLVKEMTEGGDESVVG